LNLTSPFCLLLAGALISLQPVLLIIEYFPSL